MQNENVKSNIQELNHLIYEIGAEIENVNYIKGVLGRMATNANEWKGTEKDNFFLWEHNDNFQIVNNYLFHVMKSINEKQNEIETIANQLFDVVIHGGNK